MAETFQTKVVGVTQPIEVGSPITRQEIIGRMIEPGETLLLQREQNNEADPNAVAVYFVPLNDNPWGLSKYKIGYLSQERAAQIASLMDSGWTGAAEVTARTGGDEGRSFGVNIEVTIMSPSDLAKLHASLNSLSSAQKNAAPAQNSFQSIPQTIRIENVAPTTVFVTEASPKSKTTALLLCIFLGYFGAHYFYVGRIGKGLVFFFTVGWLGIGWLIDIFVILGGGFRDSGGSPLRK